MRTSIHKRISLLLEIATITLAMEIHYGIDLVPCAKAGLGLPTLFKNLIDQHF